MNIKNKSFLRILVLVIIISLVLTLLLTTLNATISALAESPDYYTIYNENNEEICKRGEEIEVGDSYISYDNKKYKIVEIDENKNCKAQYVEDVKLPNITMETGLLEVQINEKRAGLYITHNDESYIPSDGVESIYGAGGIHDVARAFKIALQNEGFIVELDETLHLPHDNLAYRRSRTTADRIMKEFNPDVLFDIHRNGAPASLYETTVGGVPMSKVRMVVGQGNSNFEENYQFALEIKALADEWYPGLINDIYIGARDYNQDLSPQALLIEFGSQATSKEDAIKSTVPFANVINGVLQRRGVSGAFFEKPPATIMVNTENGVTEINTIFLTQLVFGSVIFILLIISLINKKLRKKIKQNFYEIKKGVLYRKN